MKYAPRIAPGLLVLGVLLSAFALQFFHLDARTLHGDEFGSLSEATRVGLNPNGILYFGFLHFWTQLGTSDIWWRIPSALFGVAAVAVNIALGTVLVNRRLGLILGALMATAPFAIEYGQQVRFYSFFLFASSLAYLAFVLYVRQPRKERLILLILANLLALGSHAFGMLVLGSEILSAFILTQRLNSRSKWILLSCTIIVFGTLLVFRPAQEFFYGLIARWTDPYGSPTYTIARGASVANLAKIPVTFFFFGVGEQLYPWTPGLVLPGLALLVIVAVLAIDPIRKSRLVLSFLPSLILLPALLFLVFDPLAPPSLQGAAPRYLIFLLPLFYLVLAMGARRKGTAWLVVPIVILNLFSLAAYWYGDWAYTDDLIDWRGVGRRVEPYVTPDTLVLVDGRSSGLAERYFPPNWRLQPNVSFSSSEGNEAAARASRLVVLSNNFHRFWRADSTAILRNIEREYDQKTGWSQYPLFVYVYDRKPDASPGYRVDAAAHTLALPTEIYGLEFQDVRLPITLDVRGRTVLSTGAFTVAGTATLPVTSPSPTRRLSLLSNVTGADRLEPGAEVAAIKVTSATGESQVFPVRLGIETAAWNGACRGQCTRAFSWRKRLALLGSEAYPGSWNDFDASIFAAEYAWNEPVMIRSLEFSRSGTGGNLYVWGIVLDP